MILHEGRDCGSHTDAHSPECCCVEHPLPAWMKVGDALRHYLAENAFTTEGYTSPKAQGSFAGFKFSVPNPPSHQRALRLHDLHHVLSGFGTDHAGEAELSAWQFRRGLRKAGLYVRSIVLLNVLVGVGVAPRRTLRAWIDAGPGQSLFNIDADYDSLLEETVGSLRVRLGLPERGLATTARRLHAHASARR